MAIGDLFMEDDSDSAWGPCEKACTAIGTIIGILAGFDGAGVGGAILGALIGAVLGWIVGRVLSGFVEYTSPSASSHDVSGCFKTIGTIIGILILVSIAIGVVVALIRGLWGVGK